MLLNTLYGVYGPTYKEDFWKKRRGLKYVLLKEEDDRGVFSIIVIKIFMDWTGCSSCHGSFMVRLLYVRGVNVLRQEQYKLLALQNKLNFPNRPEFSSISSVVSSFLSCLRIRFILA
jgi:hypothetical protein